jgi:arylsulfatase A-like enzyme
VSGTTAMTMDLMPTLVAMAGAPRPAGQRFDGADLSGVLLRDEPLAPRALFWRDADEKAVRNGPWKLVTRATRTELFNLGDDIGEQRDLSAARPERVRQLQGELAAWELQVGRRGRPR